MTKLEDKARKFFLENYGTRNEQELCALFTDEEMSQLYKSGVIERTGQPEVWAWKTA